MQHKLRNDCTVLLSSGRELLDSKQRKTRGSDPDQRLRVGVPELEPARLPWHWVGPSRVNASESPMGNRPELGGDSKYDKEKDSEMESREDSEVKKDSEKVRTSRIPRKSAALTSPCFTPKQICRKNTPKMQFTDHYNFFLETNFNKVAKKIAYHDLVVENRLFSSIALHTYRISTISTAKWNQLHWGRCPNSWSSGQTVWKTFHPASR